VRVINPKFIFVEVYDQFNRPAWNNPLPAMSWRIAEKPEALDEVAERPNRSVSMVMHGVVKILRDCERLKFCLWSLRF
jgi:hypothetical protein